MAHCALVSSQLREATGGGGESGDRGTIGDEAFPDCPPSTSVLGDVGVVSHALMKQLAASTLDNITPRQCIFCLTRIDRQAA